MIAVFCRKKSTVAFSLIEVVLAIGVISFTLISILALMSVGLTTNRQSSNDTALASMALLTLGDLRTNASLALNSKVTDYFDAQGQLTNGFSKSVPNYRCVATITQVSSSIPQVGTNLWMVSLQVSWPVSVSVAPFTNTIYATLQAP